MRDDDRSPLVREALRWFAVMRDEDLSDADRLAFERWKTQSEEHAQAWERASALWTAFEPVGTELRQVRGRTISRRTALGYGLGLLAVGIGGYTFLENRADVSTDAGERRRFVLADGSAVELNSRSALSIDYSPSRRRLILHRGEAYFTVAADRQRPFIVAAAGGETRALGTRFNIHTDDALVTVTVAEHGVEVSLPGRASERIETGWQLSYGDDWISPPVETDVAEAEAWRKGRLVYRAAPLRRVLHDMEQQRGGYVVLLDDRLGDMPVSASFDIASIDDALDSIADMLPMRVIRAGKLVFVYGT